MRYASIRPQSGLFSRRFLSLTSTGAEKQTRLLALSTPDENSHFAGREGERDALEKPGIALIAVALVSALTAILRAVSSTDGREIVFRVSRTGCVKSLGAAALAIGCATHRPVGTRNRGDCRETLYQDGKDHHAKRQKISSVPRLSCSRTRNFIADKGI